MILTHPPGDPASAIWIDLFRPTDEEIRQVGDVTGLRVPTEGQVSEIESTSRLAFENGAYYLSAPLVGASADGGHPLTPVGFVLSSRVLLTVRFAELPSFDAARSLCVAQPPKDAEEVLLHIFETIVDRAADALERLGSACDDLSNAAFRGGTHHKAVSGQLSATLRRVGEVAEKISRIRDELLALGRIGSYVTESGIEGAPQVNAARMKGIRADVTSLTDYQAHLASKVQFLLDATLGFINIEQNDIVKTLTIASVVGIPPVLIAGIYGMNFQFMPELKWVFGYPMALVLIVASGLAPLWWFKRRGWM
jgi:magnesium transporter